MDFPMFDRISYEYYNKHGLSVSSFSYNPYTHIYTIKFRSRFTNKTWTWSQIKKILTEADLKEIFEKAKAELADPSQKSFNGI